MTGLVRKATFFVACAMLLGAAASFAGIVNPANCTISANRINLVGRNSAAAGDQADSVSAGAMLTVTVRDIANNPIAGVPVVLDFSACATDLKIALTQSYHGQTTICAAPSATVQGYSTTNGTIRFVVIGGRVAGAAHAVNCGIVTADSYVLGNISVGTYDENNADGVNGVDLSAFASDLWGGTNPDRSNFNGSLPVDGADLSLFAACLWGGRSVNSGAVGFFCP